MDVNSMKGLSLDDDDNYSNISRISCGLQNSLNSAYNSDSECSGPISVKSMIQHYNSQFKSRNETQHKNTYKINTPKNYHSPAQHLLKATKSCYCGLNNYGNDLNYTEFLAQIHDSNHNNCNKQTGNSCCCKSCNACKYCQNGSHKNSTTNKILLSTLSSYFSVPPKENIKSQNTHCNMQQSSNSSSSCSCNINAKDTRLLAVKNCSNFGCDNGSANLDVDVDVDVDAAATTVNCNNNNNSQVMVMDKQKNHLLTTDRVGQETNNSICQQPTMETSYQSKTTISKTSSGVRIIIDICFDQERSANASDILGSRVETDIPQSRILNEFQQQTIIANANANAKADVDAVSDADF